VKGVTRCPSGARCELIQQSDIHFECDRLLAEIVVELRAQSASRSPRVRSARSDISGQ